MSRQRLRTSMLNRSRSIDAAGYSLPLVITAALILIAGTAVLANRAGMGLLSSIYQNQSWEAREAAEIGMSQFISELNKETNRYLMVTRSGDTAGIWTNSSSSFVKATRTNPCSAATEPTYANLDPREGTDTAKDNSYGTWYIQNDGKITRTQGTATRGFKLSGVTRQEITSSGSPLNIYSNRPTGTGKLVLRVQGFVYRNGSQVAESELEQEFELVPKCCKVSFGAAHGGLDYGINSTTNESICFNAAASLGLGLVAGAGMEGGSLTLIGNTTVKNSDGTNVSPVICIVTATNTCTSTTTGTVTTQIAKVDLTMPPPPLYPGDSSVVGTLEKCSTKKRSGSDINECPSNPTTVETNASDRLNNFTYCADGLANCNYTVVNGDVTAANLPSFCTISGGDLHCNIQQLKYDKMVFASATRKIILYFPYSNLSSTKSGYVVTPETGNSWIKNCVATASSINTATAAEDCASASGANIIRTTFYGCRINTCLPLTTTSAQTLSLQGGSKGAGLFTYFPEGAMELNGTPTYEGVMWSKTINAGGNVKYVIPAAGLTAALNLIGVLRDNESSGSGSGNILYYDFIARSTNRQRWL